MTRHHAAIMTEQHYFEIASLALADRIVREREAVELESELDESPTLTFDRNDLQEI